MKVALCCIAKNEDHYAYEWCRYYYRLGFDDIFMYQNDWRWENAIRGVKRINWPGKFQQKPAYMDFVTNRSAGYDWVAFFDLDEFLVLKKHANIKDFLTEYDNPNGIAINLQTYGANGQLDRGKYPNSLLKQFTRRSDKISPYVKLIVKLPTIGEMIDPHYWTIPMMDTNRLMVYRSLNYKGSADVAIINHYAVKSYEDWCLRCDRGYPFSPDKLSRYEEWESFKLRDCEVEDLTAKNFLYGKD